MLSDWDRVDSACIIFLPQTQGECTMTVELSSEEKKHVRITLPTVDVETLASMESESRILVVWESS